MYPAMKALLENRVPPELFNFDDRMTVQPKLDGIWFKFSPITSNGLIGWTKEKKEYDLTCLKEYYKREIFDCYHKGDIKYFVAELCYRDPITKQITRQRHKVMDFLRKHQGWEELIPNIVIVIFDVVLDHEYIRTVTSGNNFNFVHDFSYYSVFKYFVQENDYLFQNPFIACMETVNTTYGNLANIEEYYNKKYGYDLEGLVLKRIDSRHPSFFSNRFRQMHPDWFKLKKVYDATLKCVAIKPHSKNPNMIGSLILETSDKKMRVSVGSGLTKEARTSSHETFLNQLIEINYEDLLIKSKMFLNPRVIEKRSDMIVADSWEKLLSRHQRS